MACVIDADLVEYGEAVVITRHEGVRLDDTRLVGEDLHIGRSLLAFESNGDGFSGSKVSGPAEPVPNSRLSPCRV